MANQPKNVTCRLLDLAGGAVVFGMWFFATEDAASRTSSVVLFAVYSLLVLAND